MKILKVFATELRHPLLSMICVNLAIIVEGFLESNSAKLFSILTIDYRGEDVEIILI